MRKLIAVLAITIIFFGLTIALKADDNTAAAGTTPSAMGGMAVMTMQSNGATTIGGHIKITLFDVADGVRTTPAGKMGSTEYAGFSFSEVILYISHQLSDLLSIEVEPSFRASTSATPQFGSNIGQQISPQDASFGGFDRALVKYTAPGGVDISAGIVKPIFTMEYGGELFWSEEFNGSKFAADPWLGEMSDAGIEVYKAFSIGDASLPVWLYALNGFDPTAPQGASNLEFDNNNQPAAMIHVEPEMGMFKLTGSYTVGTYDTDKHDAYQRTSGGIQFNWQSLQLRSEYASGRWENKMGPGVDAKSQGWYAKVIYKLTPWLKLVYDYNVADLNFNGFFYTAPMGGENYLTHTLAIDFSITDSAYLMLQIDYADWKQNNGLDALNFIRPVIATRLTF